MWRAVRDSVDKTAVRTRLSSGEAVIVPARTGGRPIMRNILSRQLWLRGEVGAMAVQERPAGWRGTARWWLPEADRGAALRSMLPDLMPWLPPGVDAPRKLQLADRMAFPVTVYGDRKWARDDPEARRPFVDAVFVDDAAHLHLVDVLAAAGEEVLPAFCAWEDNLKSRKLDRYWLARGEDPGSAFEGEYAKLSWLRDRSPVGDVCALMQSRGDEMPEKTAQALWQRVGERCRAYWENDRSYDERGSPHSILVTDGAMPTDGELLAQRIYGNRTLVCVTPFVFDGGNWLRVDVRGWAGMDEPLSESVVPAEDRICRMAGATDVGKERHANQDAVVWDEKDGWAAVADGMGGHPKGDIASANVLRDFIEAMRQWPDADAMHPRRTVAQRLRRAAEQGHAALWEENKDAGIFERMGTTLSALRLHGDRVSFVHAGDSRIYAFKPGGSYSEPRLQQLTLDHGERGGLDRALGLWERVPFDTDTLPVGSETLYLLCTDGLTNMVSDREIMSLCLRHTGREWDVAGLRDALIAAANEAGGYDNITVCLVEARAPRESR